MSSYQSQYADITRRLMKNPKKIGDSRIGKINSNFVETIRIDLEKEFPIMDIKWIKFSNVVHELLWMLRGETNPKYLIENGCNIWTDDSYRYYKEKYERYSNNILTKDEFVNEIKEGSNIGDLGKIYGHSWRKYNGFRKRTPKIITELSKVINIDYSQNKTNFVGKKSESNNFGEYTVIKEYYVGKQIRFDIQFIKTGYIRKKITKQNILVGEVRDSYYPKVHGVACVGDEDIAKTELGKNLRSTWEGMISRCYNKKNKSNWKLYGGKGVYVDDKWLIFSNFVKDVQKIENWNKKINNWKEYTLDKDYYGNGYYGIDSCIWLSKKDQVKYSQCSDITFNEHLFFSGTDQVQNVLDKLKSNPDDRRMIIIGHNPTDLEEGNVGLPACHNYMQFYTKVGEDGRRKLSLHCHIRSNDFGLGNPYNTIQYALLVHIFAKLSDMDVDELVITATDAHLYHIHFEPAQIWLDRFNEISGKRVFKIEVGSIPEDEIDEYIAKVVKRFKKTIPIDEEDFFLPIKPSHSAEIIDNTYCKAKFNLLTDATNVDDLKAEDFLLMDYKPQPYIKAQLLT